MALRDSDPAEVGGYRIEDRLGSGGMGIVYLARSASGRRLALKLVHDQYADDDEFRTRFRREVAAARRVSGAFTAPVVDADADAPRPWMATLYIPAADLGTHVREHGPLPLPRLRELAVGLAEALRDIHRAGVVHRDLKPANVMLAEDGPRVIDFGISRAAEAAASDALTQTGRVMGTPPFMSPEQFSSPQDVGPAADVFSLGSVLVYAATRRGPFDSPSPYQTALKVVECDADLAGVPDDLVPVVRRCLQRDPASRPTPGELLTLLRDRPAPAPRAGELPAGPAPASAEPAPASAEPEPAPAEPAPSARRRRRVVAAVVATVAVIAAVTATTLTVGRDTGASAPDDLPEDWRPWAAAAKGEPGTHPFQRCAATGTSLVCAGDDLMATRFALADGRTTWSRPVDPTPDDSGDNEGTVIGTRGGHVYVYGADQRETADDLLPTRYTVQALAADSGRVLWRTVTGDGESATAPNSEYGSATAIPEGVLTLFGPRGDTYALLDAEDGRVRWKRPLPKGPDACLLRGAAGRPYLLCLTGLDPERPSRTTLTRLDPDTGEARWRIEADGALDLLGQDRGRLVLAEGLRPGRTLTLVDAATRVLTTVRLSHPQSEDADAHLERGTLYFTLSSGTVRAVSPHTGRRLWESNSTVEQQGPPTVSADRVYVASPSGRLAALDARTGKVVATRPGRDDGTPAVADLIVSGAPLVLVGDALYVPYGARSVYTVNTRDL